MNAITRRAALATAAMGAFTFAFRIPTPGEAAAQTAATPEVNAWVVIKPDNTVTIRIARSEMGQGTLTGLAQMVAEELECDWSKVTTEYPTPGQNLARGRVWGNMSTGGSRGIRESNELVRKGGAAARIMLVQAAAQAWGVPAGECTAANSVITHGPSGRTASFGSVALAAGRLTPPAAADVPLKAPSAWKLIGQPVPRLDTAPKINGSQIYGMDLKLPGMLNAAIQACPVFGGTVAAVDSAAAERLPGVKRVLRVGDNAVAVVADTWWRAKTALEAVKITWNLGEHANASSAGFAEVMRAGLEAPQAAVGNSNGNAAAAIAAAPRKVEAVYGYPHQNHACMEVMNATAIWTAERCEVWTPTQNGEAAHAATAEAAGLPPARCEVHKLHLGGGFGRRGAVHDWVRQVVDIAKQMPGTPVKLLWTREEDMAQGRYHPVTMAKLTAGLDAAGNITGLHMRISGQSIIAGLFPQNIRDGRDPVVFQGLNNAGGEADIGYGFPNLLIDHAMRNPHVPPGFWRGVNLNQNAFYLECFMDELAHAAGKDPLEFRRALMANHPKHLGVLNAVAERVGWGTQAAPIGGQAVHRGLCVTHGYGSYVAACAEVSVSNAGALKIHRIVAATDPGYPVNPQQIAAQVEGSFVYGLTAALYSECTVKNGRIEQSNFDNYQMMKMDMMPKVETIIVPTGGFWGGVGEPTIAVAAPAVLNAIFAATGKRIRQLPLGDADLRRA